MLVSVVDDDRSARKSTSIDVDSRGISVKEKGAASVLNNKDPLTVADNNDSYEDRSTVGDGQNEIPLNEKDVDTRLREDESKPSNAEFSSQSKGEKEKKNKSSKGTGSAQSNAKGEEVKKEEQNSSEGI